MGLSNGKCTSTARLDGVTAVITGANTGIGKVTAEDFYKRGARVHMCCRDPDKARAAVADIERLNPTSSGGTFGQLLPGTLDLASLASVRALADDLLRREVVIHLLVNNAGVMLCPKGKTEDGFETQFGVNHLGHFLLTVLLLPAIVRGCEGGGKARVVNVASLAHTQDKDNRIHTQFILIYKRFPGWT